MNHKTIPLTQGHVALVDADDYAWLSEHKWRCVFNGRASYAARSVLVVGAPKIEWMHRRILEYHGTDMDGLDTDHKNRNGLDNRRANLRPATHDQNMQNRKLHRNNSSGFMGVYWSERRQKWRANIYVVGRKIFLGRYDDLLDAARAYDAGALEHHGEFASLNYPEEQS